MFGSGLKLRLMIAAGIALFSLISYLSTGDKNPITGQTQRVAMSADQEIRMGLQAAPEMASQHGGLYPNQEAQNTVDRVGVRLVSALNGWLEGQQRQNPYQFDFHLLRDDRSINAFALPGGQVFITFALYRRLQTEGQLAGVLGHEIGHVLQRHGSQRMAQQKLTSGLTGAVGMAGGSNASAQLARAVGQLITMKYGRNDELESDKWGVMLTGLAGYSPEAMLGVMRILDEASQGSPPEMLSTHPKPANRIQYIQDIIRQVYPEGLPGGLVP